MSLCIKSFFVFLGDMTFLFVNWDPPFAYHFWIQCTCCGTTKQWACYGSYFYLKIQCNTKGCTAKRAQKKEEKLGVKTGPSSSRVERSEISNTRSILQLVHEVLWDPLHLFSSEIRRGMATKGGLHYMFLDSTRMSYVSPVTYWNTQIKILKILNKVSRRSS